MRKLWQTSKVETRVGASHTENVGLILMCTCRHVRRGDGKRIEKSVIRSAYTKWIAFNKFMEYFLCIALAKYPKHHHHQ